MKRGGQGQAHRLPFRKLICLEKEVLEKMQSSTKPAMPESDRYSGVAPEFDSLGLDLSCPFIVNVTLG